MSEILLHRAAPPAFSARQITVKVAPDTSPLVLIVDDDPLVGGAMDSLFRSVGLRTRVYHSAIDVFADRLPDITSCLVVDIRMPQVSGLEFQAQLTHRGVCIPIVFITGHGDIPMSVRAMKAGAVDFLTKPFRDQDILDAVTAALAMDGERRVMEDGLAELQARYARLTPRERSVMAGVTKGLLNKQVAGDLGISEITVKLHRGSLMRKMGTTSLADLVRAAEALTRSQQSL